MFEVGEWLVWTYHDLLHVLLIIPAVAMRTADFYRWRKPESITKGQEVARMTVYLRPVTWCLRMYDDHLASKFRHQPDIHELARRARGGSPLDAPVLLPRKRKRTLTNPLPALESIQGLSYSIQRSRQRNDDQLMSPFLAKLPFEIRQIIYEEVLADGGGSVVHILRKYGRLGHWRCRIQDGSELCSSQGCRCVEGWLSYKPRVWQADKSGRLDLITDDGLLPLLRTCRVVYSEAIRVLYSKNIFHFYDPGDIRYFGHALLHQRLNAVQSIIMDWERTFSIFNPDNTMPKQDEKEWRAWRETWTIIAGMQGLKEVKVVLKSHKFVVWKARRMKMCRPLMEVKGLKIFEVIVPWDDEGDWDFVANAPFTIVRGPNRSGT